MMVEAKVRSLIDQTLNTGVEEHYLFKDQVFVAIFKCDQVLEDLIKIGVIELVDDDVPEQKIIPVLYPPPMAEGTVCVSAWKDNPNEHILFDAHGNEIPLSGFTKDQLK